MFRTDGRDCEDDHPGRRCRHAVRRGDGRSPGFGHVELDGDRVSESEEPQIGEGWINGGFIVLEQGVFDYIEREEMQFQREPLERLAADGQLMAYRHTSFWQCMDTLRDKNLLQHLWDTDNAPWKGWS